MSILSTVVSVVIQELSQKASHDRELAIYQFGGPL